MTTALLPRLAPLDERVLGALTTTRGQREGSVAALLFGAPHWECERCGHTTRSDWGGHPPAWLQRKSRPICRECHPSWSTMPEDVALMHPLLIASPGDTQTVRQVLRGLEAVGLARCAGGWWRRA